MWRGYENSFESAVLSETIELEPLSSMSRSCSGSKADVEIRSNQYPDVDVPGR